MESSHPILFFTATSCMAIAIWLQWRQHYQKVIRAIAAQTTLIDASSIQFYYPEKEKN